MQNFIKSVAAAVGGWLWVALSPAIPAAVACTAMVMADVWSARRLQGRLAKNRPTERQLNKFSSARFGRVIATLSRIYGALTVAALVQHAVTGEWAHLLEFVAGIICFWQGVSILENESSCNPRSWARALGKYVVDKSSRYTD